MRQILHDELERPRRGADAFVAESLIQTRNRQRIELNGAGSIDAVFAIPAPRQPMGNDVANVSRHKVEAFAPASVADRRYQLQNADLAKCLDGATHTPGRQIAQLIFGETAG